MSDYRFGLDDYRLNYYPREAANEDYGVDWDKVERVEIEWVDFIRERTCKMKRSFTEPSRLDFMQEYECGACGEYGYMQIACDGDGLNYCPNCGAKVQEMRGDAE